WKCRCCFKSAMISQPMRLCRPVRGCCLIEVISPRSPNLFTSKSMTHTIQGLPRLLTVMPSSVGKTTTKGHRANTPSLLLNYSVCESNSPSCLPVLTIKTWQNVVAYLWNIHHHRTTTELLKVISKNSQDCARICKRVEPSPPHCKVSRSSCNMRNPIAKW